ncbi:MAG TPA: amidohydrolase [Bacteroidia bacterium]|nr:amidohydrolase [Bacteroidia bacterium]HNT80996.1 amidohydrolase [Bacteroidia bacterium]
MKPVLILFSILTCFFSCSPPEQVDLILYNGKIYTVDSAMTIVEAMAIKDGLIYKTGNNDIIKKLQSKNSIDLEGKTVYPGFYDAHCHFYGYGIDKKKIWLGGTSSYQAILDTLKKRKEDTYMGWVFGRGWDQNDWDEKNYPDNESLNQLFPDIPVFLFRIDGHAAIVNQKALDLAGINEQTKVYGGEIILKNGKPSGVLIDNAVDLVKLKIPTPGKEQQIEGLLSAQKDCFAVGLTSVSDAGLERDVIALLNEMHQDGTLKMRIYAMIAYNDSNLTYYKENGKIKTDRLNVSSFKVYADGALGSRGACLKHEYSDQKNHSGFLLHNISEFEELASFCTENKFQFNAHCIGDSAARLIMNIASAANKNLPESRWRIEHAQVLDKNDFELFSRYKFIPSVQPTHATSDMYWAEDRIGSERIPYAYAYGALINAAGMIAAGSDFPVEDINPLYGFYAAVVRKDKKGYPEKGFQIENAITREQALKAMTIWAAYAAFEETEKGSLEKNKMADFVILDKDLMNADENELWNIKVLQTFVAGESVYKR